ncbi:MAG: HAMP domain-containing protein, partial [bacterium]
MATLRARLTVAYGFALVGNVIVFSGALLIAHNSRGTQLSQLAQVAIAQADRANGFLREAAREGKPLTEERPCGESSTGPILPGSATGDCVFATVEMLVLLDRVPGYYVVYGRDNRQLYSSVGIRQMPVDDRARIDQQAVRLSPDEAAPVIKIDDRLFGGGLLMVARTDLALQPNIVRIVAGAPTTTVELSPNTLVGTMFLVLPLVILASIGVSYAIAGGAVEPIERLINEVEAITDGRSLHRRLPSDLGNDELSRLGNTLNAMIGR